MCHLLFQGTECAEHTKVESVLFQALCLIFFYGYVFELEEACAVFKKVAALTHAFHKDKIELRKNCGKGNARKPCT